MGVRFRRADLPARSDDGTRVLIDRYWPRGLAPDAVDRWPRSLAPSAALTAWYGRKPERWDEFCRRYREELGDAGQHPEAAELQRLARAGTITLLYRGRDAERNLAAVLAGVLSLPAWQPEPAAPASSTHLPTLRFAGLSPVGAVMEWSWLILGLGAPVLALLSLELLVSAGGHGVQIFLVLLALLCAGTFARAFLRDRRLNQPEVPLNGEGRQSIWVGVLNLGVAGAGTLLGILCFCLLIAWLAIRNGTWH